MELSIFPSCEILELTVVLFQVMGIGSLCFSRLVPHSRYAERARLGYVLALFGLGFAGALCGQHDSQFALFAGGTMTILLIGMISGGGSLDISRTSRQDNRGETAFSG